MGCFWGADDVRQADGVYTTAVGYAGGFTPNPLYEEVCSGSTGHTEVVLVAFDREKTSDDKTLKDLLGGPDPTQGMRQGNDMGTQYRSAAYWNSRGAVSEGRGLARRFPEAPARREPRRDHDRDR